MARPALPKLCWNTTRRLVNSQTQQEEAYGVLYKQIGGKRYTLASGFQSDRKRLEKVAHAELAKILGQQKTNPDGWTKAKQSVVDEVPNFYMSLHNTSLGNQGNVIMVFDKYILPFLDGDRIEDIDSQHVRKFFAHLKRKVDCKTISWKRANTIFKFYVWFISYLVGNDFLSAMPKPLVIHATRKTFTFKPRGYQTPPPEDIPLVDIARVWQISTGRFRCFIEMALLTGWTQIDIANLRFSEIDYENRIITRKRTKTRDKENVPIVSYKIPDYECDDPLSEWVKYMQHECDGSDDICFVNNHGNPFAVSSFDLEKKKSVRLDSIGLAWKYHCKKLGLPHTFKQIRKTGATILRNHHEYFLVHQLFLGHASKLQSERSYTRQGSTELLAKGIAHIWNEFRAALGELEEPDLFADEGAKQ